MKSSLWEVGWFSMPLVKVVKELETNFASGCLSERPFLNGSFDRKALLLRFLGRFLLVCAVFFRPLKLEALPARLQLPKQL